jgi:hypothetical protein
VLAQEPLGDFYYFERSDPETGADRSSVTGLADESFVSGTGGLTVRCAEDGIELVLTSSYLGRPLSAPVRYSFGDEEPREASWTVRSTGMAAIAPREVVSDFLTRAVGESTVVFRVSDFQFRVHTYTFHLGGLDSALNRLTCR